MGLMCLVEENGNSYIPQDAVVYNPAVHADSMLKIFLAASGFTSVKIVRQFDDRVTTSMVAEPPLVQDERARVALSPPVNAEILNALAPSASVKIGSLVALFPSTRWRLDGGAKVIDWGPLLDRLAPTPAPVFSVAASRPNANEKRRISQLENATSARNVHVYLGVVPSVFTKGLTKFSSRVTSVSGVPLTDGDMVKDVDGITWYYRDGMLQDRIRMTVSADAMKAVNAGASIVPRSSSAKAPDGYVPDSLYELLVTWSPTDATPFKARSLPKRGGHGRDWGWDLFMDQPTVEHVRGTCQGPGGIALDRATPELCVADGGTWDRPCETDTECPFYDPRRSRGGCSRSGFCEMPLGVDSRSFRLAADASQTMRHGCQPNDADYPRCSAAPDSDVRFPNHRI